MKDLQTALDEIVRIAIEAGGVLLEGLDGEKDVHHKGDVDLLTQFDLRSEELIRQRLGRSFPAVPVLAEEGGGDTAGASARFIVDPLDGTTNFAHGHPLFCVSMALELEGVMSCGVVHVPACAWTFTARFGGGAHRNGQALFSSKEASLCKAMLATGFPYDRRTSNDDNTREHRAFMKKCQAVRRMGSAALDLAFVSAGIYDGFWEMGLKPWDIAAGMLLVTEAGGLLTDYDGRGAMLETGCVIAAGNPPLHEAMTHVLRECRGAAHSGQ
ncbi:MAG: inositol monophosphatase [Myxococcota bacterium]|jgi:myo-inositol-1(or 4)-monophosphatase|nr:inositol monophosphatase [Myxococcota bacterium]